MESLAERRAAAQVFEDELNRAARDTLERKSAAALDKRVAGDVARDRDVERTLAE